MAILVVEGICEGLLAQEGSSLRAERVPEVVQLHHPAGIGPSLAGAQAMFDFRHSGQRGKAASCRHLRSDGRVTLGARGGVSTAVARVAGFTVRGANIGSSAVLARLQGTQSLGLKFEDVGGQRDLRLLAAVDALQQTLELGHAQSTELLRGERGVGGDGGHV